MVFLDCFAGITELALKRENLKLIERTFQAYLGDTPKPGAAPPSG